jgi:hypothetical protein
VPSPAENLLRVRLRIGVALRAKAFPELPCWANLFCPYGAERSVGDEGCTRARVCGSDGRTEAE